MSKSAKQPYQIYYKDNDGTHQVGEIKRPSFKSIMQKVREYSGHVNANHRNIDSVNNHARDNQIIVTQKNKINLTFVVSLPDSLHHLIK